MGVGAGLYMSDVVEKLTFAILISWWVLAIFAEATVNTFSSVKKMKSTANWENFFRSAGS